MLYPTNEPFNSARPRMMYVDINSCFATIEQQANPSLRGRPIVVAAYTTPYSCILTPSIEAKKLGIRVGMRVKEGKYICPRLVILPPDPEKYRFINRKLFTLLQQYTADVCVLSIDEMALSFSNTPIIEKKSMEEIAKEIKQRIHDEIGEWITVSIGIAPNRYLAKIASSLQKPDGLVTIDSHSYAEIYKKLYVEELCGIKERNARRLQTVGVRTVWQMYQVPATTLKQAFHSVVAYYWYKRLRGYEIDSISFTRKSYGHSYVLPEITTNKHMLRSILTKLVEKIGKRLRDGGYSTHHVHLSCTFADHSSWHKGEQTSVQIYATSDLCRKAMELLLRAPQKPIRSLAVSCTQLEKYMGEQLTLSLVEEKKRSLIQALDTITNRFGLFQVFPASMMGTEEKVPDRIAFGRLTT